MASLGGIRLFIMVDASHPVAKAAGEQPRIAIFTHDGRGLGHLTRLSLIARQLQGRCAVLIVTGHRAASWIVPEECEFIHVPSLDSLDIRRSRQRGRRPFWEDGATGGRLLRKVLLQAIFDGFRPDAVILDYLPMGNEEELYDFIAARKAQRSYFIVRGILADALTVNQQILNRKGRYLLSSCYDRIFVTADEKIIDVAQEYGMPPEMAQKVVYAGYVVRGCAQEDRRTVREERGVPEGVAWVVCSAGGGKDGEDLMESGFSEPKSAENGGRSNGESITYKS
jgi:predicted glycosyltransferase